MSNKPSFPVGINVLVVRDGKILLGKRKNAYGAGTWGLPGGHLENGEQMMDAAARELMEETGLQAISFEFINLFNNNQGQATHYLQIGFVAHDVKGEPTLKEPDRCEEWQWFDIKALPTDLFQPHKPNIEGLTEKRYFAD